MHMIGRRRYDRRYEGIPDELAGKADRTESAADRPAAKILASHT